MSNAVAPAAMGVLGRATLLRALHAAREGRALDESSGEQIDRGQRWAALLGYVAQGAAAPLRDESGAAPDDSTQRLLPPAAVPDNTSGTAARQPLAASFFAITGYDQRTLETDEGTSVERPGPDVQPLGPEDCRPRSVKAPAHTPLVRSTRLWPALRRSLAVSWVGGLDVRRLVQDLADARPPRRLPRVNASGVGASVHVWWDRADHLQPYDRDYADVLSHVHRQCGTHGLRVWQVDGLPTQVLGELLPTAARGDAALARRELVWQPAGRAVETGTAASQRGNGAAWLPAPGSTVLLLGDAGALGAEVTAPQTWSAWLRQMENRQCRVVIWVPCGAQWVWPEHTDLARVHSLASSAALRAPLRHMPKRSEPARQAAQHRRLELRDRLLTRAAVCLHLAPALLRSLRLGDTPMAHEPAVEAWAWGAGELVQRSRVSRAVAPDQAMHYRQKFAELAQEEQRDILQRILAAHASLGRSTETAEVLIWQAHAHADAAKGEGALVAQAQTWVQAWIQRVELDAARGALGASARQYAADLLARTRSDQSFIARHEDWTSRLWAISGSDLLPAGVSEQAAMHAATVLSRNGDRGPMQFWLFTRPGELALTSNKVAVPRDRLHNTGPIVAHHALIERSDGSRQWVDEPTWLVKLADAGKPGQTLSLFLDDFKVQVTELARPAWASAWGRDQYGLFASIEIQGITQRLRYILPGQFQMGSQDGVGQDLEHPQHQVTLTEGYWLADTPCTQALWQAVMGDNPSQFEDGADAPERPVESVSWDDVQGFLLRLSQLLPSGCEPILPTEAQWEYAARAGTSTAYWWGDEPDDARANWSRQHQGTTPVRHFAANPWGLYDVHGNVWEWCLDDRRDYGPHSVRDPHGDLESSVRALRGGSWSNDPDDARSACRRGGHRDNRDRFQGFRLSLRSPSPGAGGPGQGGGTGGPATGAGRPGAAGALPRPKGAPRNKKTAAKAWKRK